MRGEEIRARIPGDGEAGSPFCARQNSELSGGCLRAVTAACSFASRISSRAAIPERFSLEIGSCRGFPLPLLHARARAGAPGSYHALRASCAIVARRAALTTWHSFGTVRY